MSRLSAFDTYCKFLALKNHFTQKKYDYFKYHGKVTASKESFQARRDRFQFQKMSRKLDENELVTFIVANLAAGKSWVGDMLDTDADANYQAFRKQQESMTYIFEQELSKAFQAVDDPKDLFHAAKGQYPPLLSMQLSGDVSLMTFAVLNAFVDFASKFDERIGEDDPIWSKVRDRAIKLLPFIEYDKAKLGRVLKKVVDQAS